MSFSPPTSAIPSLPASTRTYVSYSANSARPSTKDSESGADVEHNNEIDDNNVSTTFSVFSNPSPIQTGPLRIQPFISRHREQHQSEENSDGDSTSIASSPLASPPTTSARASIAASVDIPNCPEMEALMQALHYKISVDHHQTPLYIAAVEYLFMDTIYQGMGERIFADAQYRRGIETNYHDVRRSFMNNFRTYLQDPMRLHKKTKVQVLGDEKGPDCEAGGVGQNDPKLGHCIDEKEKNWHGSVFYDTDEEGEIADIVRLSTETDMPLKQTSVPNPSGSIPHEENTWHGPGCYDTEEEVQYTYIILEEAWQACQDADRAISSLTVQLTECKSVDGDSQDSTLHEIFEDEETMYESESEASCMLGKKQSVDEKQGLNDGEIIAQGAAVESCRQWHSGADKVMAGESTETPVLRNSEGVAVEKLGLHFDTQKSEPEHFSWARAQEGLKAEKKKDVDWGNCVSTWRGVVAEELVDESEAEWIAAADTGENDIKDEVEAEMLREEHYGEDDSALVAQCGLVL